MAEGGDQGVLRLRATWWRRCLADPSFLHASFLAALGIAGVIAALAGDGSVWWAAASFIGLVVPPVLLQVWLLTGEVVVDAEGIAVEHFHRRRCVPWREIDAVELGGYPSPCPAAKRTSARASNAPLYVVDRGELLLSPLMAANRDYRHQLVAPLLAAAQDYGCRVRIAKQATRLWNPLKEA